MNKPTLFVGSSTEGIDVARAIQEHLIHDAEVTLWSDSLFELGRATLESLVELIGRFDFAVLVLSPDDIATIRGQTMAVPRDNVVFELGLFMGRLGRERTFAVCDRDLPIWNDLAGITMAIYDRRRSDGNITAALGPTCNQIRKAMARLGFRQSMRSVPEFWRPFLSEESLIVIGHFDMPHFESSGLIGFGDAMALIEIQTYCDSMGLPHPPVRDAKQLGANDLSKNLILVGGPDENRITEKVNDRIPSHLASTVSAVEDLRAGVKYVPGREGGSLSRDLGVIIQAESPLNAEKKVLLLFGCYGYGTWAAARFSKTSSFLDAPSMSVEKGVACVIQTDVIQDAPCAIQILVLRGIR